MKNLTLLLSIVFLVTSFKVDPPKKDFKLKLGTYALNTIYQEESEKIVSGLNFNEDMSFVYFNKEQKTEIKGTWKIENNFVILYTESKLPIKNKWKIDSNEKCLTTRKGLCFYRVCNC